MQTKSFHQNYDTQVKYAPFQNKSKQKLKKAYKFLLELQKTRPPKDLVQLPIWKGGQGILDKDTQLNSLKTKQIQKLLNPTNAFQKDLMLY